MVHSSLPGRDFRLMSEAKRPLRQWVQEGLNRIKWDPTPLPYHTPAGGVGMPIVVVRKALSWPPPKVEVTNRSPTRIVSAGTIHARAFGSLIPDEPGLRVSWLDRSRVTGTLVASEPGLRAVVVGTVNRTSAASA